MRIGVDCGHGLNTPGKRTPALPFDVDFENDGKIDIAKGGTIKEHVINVRVGKFLVDELKRCGFDVYESGFGDEDISIADRQKNIKNAKCDYTVSIHFNAFGESFNDANGVEVFYHSNKNYIKDSQNLSNVILKHLLNGTEQRNRGIKTQGLGLCNCVAMGTKASILVELAFMTNLEEVKLIATDSFLKECAQNVAQGFCEYLGIKYIVEPIKNPNTPIYDVTGAQGYVKVLVNNLNIWNRPLWYESAICGTVNKGEVFTVDDKVKANKGYMYKLKSGVYITTNEQYVQFYTK